MPLLTKKAFGKLKPLSVLETNKDEFKSPLSVQENIDKVLKDPVNKNIHAKFSKKNFVLSQPAKFSDQNKRTNSFTLNKKGKRDKDFLSQPTKFPEKFDETSTTAFSLSGNKKKANRSLSNDMSISFSRMNSENTDTTENNSDISSRMNEPAIKDAYFEFLKKLSQESEAFNVGSLNLSKNENIQEKVSQQLPFDQVNVSPLLFEDDKFKSLSMVDYKLTEPAPLAVTDGEYNTEVAKDNCQLNSSVDVQIVHQQNIFDLKAQEHSQKQMNTNILSTSQKNGIEIQSQNLAGVLISPSLNNNGQGIVSVDSGLSLSQQPPKQMIGQVDYSKVMQSIFKEDDLSIFKKRIVGRSRQCVYSSEDSLKQNISQSHLSQRGEVRKVKKRQIKIPKSGKTEQSVPSEEETEKYQGKTVNRGRKKNLRQSNKEKPIKNKKLKLKTANTETDEAISSEVDNLTLYEKMKLIHESRDVGLYVLCDICNKARYLPDVHDPLDLPDKWYCSMNADINHNECSDPEEVNEDEDFMIENEYNAGSVVWAKMAGYPWWPAMVEDDPDTETYFWLDDSKKPNWYHVTFFDSHEVTRAWMKPSALSPFKINMYNSNFHDHNLKYKSRLEASINQAKDAIQLPLLDRLKKYSFIYRFKNFNKPKGVKKSANRLHKQKEKLNLKLKDAMKPSKKTSVKKRKFVGVCDSEDGALVPSVQKRKHRRNWNNSKLRTNVNDSENDNVSLILDTINWEDAEHLDFNMLNKF